VIPVPNDESERRAERPPVPEARQHLHLVLLELLARAASVSLLATVEIRVDRPPVEGQAGGQTLDDCDKRRTVRFPSRCET
jgi:hypothetical protein